MKDSNIDIAVGTGGTEHQEVDSVNNFSQSTTKFKY